MPCTTLTIQLIQKGEKKKTIPFTWATKMPYLSDTRNDPWHSGSLEAALQLNMAMTLIYDFKMKVQSLSLRLYESETIQCFTQQNGFCSPDQQSSRLRLHHDYILSYMIGALAPGRNSRELRHPKNLTTPSVPSLVEFDIISKQTRLT